MCNILPAQIVATYNKPQLLTKIFLPGIIYRTGYCLATLYIISSIVGSIYKIITVHLYPYYKLI